MQFSVATRPARVLVAAVCRQAVPRRVSSNKSRSAREPWPGARPRDGMRGRAPTTESFPAKFTEGSQKQRLGRQVFLVATDHGVSITVTSSTNGLPHFDMRSIRCRFRVNAGSGTVSVNWLVWFSWCAGRVCGVGRGWRGRPGRTKMVTARQKRPRSRRRRSSRSGRGPRPGSSRPLRPEPGESARRWPKRSHWPNSTRPPRSTKHWARRRSPAGSPRTT